MTPTEALLAAAIHEWNESNRDRGCIHFDKGFGPYAECEDEGLGVPHAVVLRLLAPSDRVRALVIDFADQLLAIIESKWADRPTADAAVELWRRDLLAALAQSDAQEAK